MTVEVFYADDVPVEGIRPEFQVTQRAMMKKRRAPKGPQSGPVTEFRVHPLVWEHALLQADGDPQRIEVVGPSKVNIHNNRTWRQKKSRRAL